jgi:beta-fructofuranosidase
MTAERETTTLNDLIVHARALREHFLRDPHRPGYHFVVPEGTHAPVDPNGALYWNGRYHVCYIFQHEGKHYWGHASSVDLLHWRHHAPALCPGEGDEGIFSGGAFVDQNGVATITYWRLGKPDGIAIATSTDPQLDRWTKSPHNPVLPSTGFGWAEVPAPDGSTAVVGTADPSAIWWKDGRYYLLTGNLPVILDWGQKRNLPEYMGDTLYLFVSDDLAHWTYLHKFYESRREWTKDFEDDMCPDFFPLPASADGGPASDRHMILFISHTLGCQYYTGRYENDRFTPETHGRMTWVDNAYFAPESLVDGQGRRIMWTWVFDQRDKDAREASGWSGEMSLPRVLWLGEDNTLRMRPAQELERLRYNPRRVENLAVQSGAALPLAGMGGNSYELDCEIAPGEATQCGLKVCCSPGGEEETLIAYDVAQQALQIDTRKSSSNGQGKQLVESAPLTLRPGEPLRLRVFVDKSIVEVYANDRQAVVRRIYPSREDSAGIALIANGAAVNVPWVQFYEMMPSNPY